MGLVGRLPACFCASSLARGFGQASYNLKQLKPPAPIAVPQASSPDTLDIPPDTQVDQIAETGPTVLIRRIQVDGNTVLPQKQVDASVAINDRAGDRLAAGDRPNYRSWRSALVRNEKYQKSR